MKFGIAIFGLLSLGMTQLQLARADEKIECHDEKKKYQLYFSLEKNEITDLEVFKKGSKLVTYPSLTMTKNWECRKNTFSTHLGIVAYFEFYRGLEENTFQGAIMLSNWIVAPEHVLECNVIPALPVANSNL